MKRFLKLHSQKKSLLGAWLAVLDACFLFGSLDVLFLSCKQISALFNTLVQRKSCGCPHKQPVWA